MPGKRIAALQGVAVAMAAGEVPVDAMDAAGASLDQATLRQAWLALPGIGPWTVEYIAMRKPGATPTPGRLPTWC